MKTVKAILSRVIYTEPTPLPPNNASSNNRQSTGQTCNHSPSPQRHLTPGQYISDESSQNHDQQNHYSHQPNKFTRLCITCVIQTTEKVHVHYNEKQTRSIGVQITQLPAIRNITHLVLNTMESLIYVCCIMHCQENTSPNLQNKAQSGLNTPVIIPVQIRRGRVTNQMILRYYLHGLIPLATTQFFDRSCH